VVPILQLHEVVTVLHLGEQRSDAVITLLVKLLSKQFLYNENCLATFQLFKACELICILPSYRLYAHVDIVIRLSRYPSLSHYKTPHKLLAST
jgi:hypothetical protein